MLAKLDRRVVAHRGLQRLYPENTRASVLAALDAGLDKVEIDVQLSADRVPVVHHDADLKRMTGKAGDLRRLPWARLQRLAAPEPGRFGRRYGAERLCPLKALALALARYDGYTLFVELKEESLRPFGRSAMLAAVAEALQPIQRRCVLISFDLAVLALARRDTRFPVGLVLRSWEQWASPPAKALRADWAFCDARLLPKAGGLKALFRRSRSAVYEVPQAERARALLGRGIDAIETFRADSLAQELALYR
jgi:glycerophosphoryl diester phosphodiesterase